MLGVLCARPKPWIVASCFSHASAAHHCSRLPWASAVRLQLAALTAAAADSPDRRRHHSSSCRLGSGGGSSPCGAHPGGVASIWHAILPSGEGDSRRTMDPRRPVFRGEGSWNVAWDARPARWLHRPDSAWLLFGVCACLAPVDAADLNREEIVPEERVEDCDSSDEAKRNSPDYRVTGVLADGRCLFRAIAHCACLRKGEAAPDDNRQRELADELRAQVVDELLKRREETEWAIEGDFDAYIERIQQPYVWGGEPELLMASHVLKTLISVFMVDRSSGSLVNIAKYGEEYRKDEESPINVLFHGYGHYDILESFAGQSY
ncbi:uncharacterized protein LOC115665158 [Syzygium oleosum]|uniref:uncharacterized protein LOC115665158 n=1 Tax=Syzygium oleosum TaxID=219896 RepID=UPI0024B89BE0|nr:uncharacterized protein LOC115665158 [Syzygium oleosum]